MISAGQTYNPYNYNQPTQGQQSKPSFNMPTFQPIQYMPTKGMNWDLKIKDKKQVNKAMAWQGGIEAGKVVSNMGTSIANAILAGQSMSAQREITTKYYDTQDNIAGYQRDVALRQLGVQETAVFVQRQMHATQTGHEKEMMKLEGGLQARLAQIHENGKTQRAKVMILHDAFSARNNWSYGNPMMS